MRYEFKPEFTEQLAANPDRIWLPEELVAFVLDEKAPFAAGKGWDYSDTNYIVLGMILERLTGTRAYDEIQKRFLVPLKLSGVVPSDRREIPGLVQGYAGKGNPFGGVDGMVVDGKLVIQPQFEWAGGGFATTAVDLARWMLAVQVGKAFAPALLEQASQGVPSRLGQGIQYGLGMILWPTRHGPARGHSGFFPGFVTEVRYYVDHGFAVAMQVNTSVGRALGRPLGVMVDELVASVLSAVPVGR
jgi:D-alanyl-D-alanine carboxypeptidase